VADLQVSLAFLLENQEEVARELERAGGIAGKDFGAGLSEGAKKAFQDLIAQADKAAKEAGIKFNRTDLSFRTRKLDWLPPPLESKEGIKSLALLLKKLALKRQARRNRLPSLPHRLCELVLAWMKWPRRCRALFAVQRQQEQVSSNLERLLVIH